MSTRRTQLESLDRLRNFRWLFFATAFFTACLMGTAKGNETDVQAPKSVESADSADSIKTPGESGWTKRPFSQDVSKDSNKDVPASEPVDVTTSESGDQVSKVNGNEKDYAASETASAKTMVEPDDGDPIQAGPSQADSSKARSSKRISATPVSGRLDAFKARVALHSRKNRSDDRQEPAEVERPKESIQTPGDRELKRFSIRSRSSGTNWQRREGATDPRPIPDADVPRSDASKRFYAEDTWVARDAINRIAPLTDPSPVALPSESSKPQRQTTNLSTPLPQQRPNSQNLSESTKSVEALPLKEKVRRPKDLVSKVGDTISGSVEASPSPKAPEDTDAVAAIRRTSPRSKKETPAMSLNEAAGETVAGETAAAEKLLRSVDSESRRTKETAGRSSQKASVAKAPTRNDGQSEARAKPAQSQVKVDVDREATVGDLPVVGQEELPLDYAGYPSEGVQPTRVVASMRYPIERVLRYFYERPEVSNGRSNWGMMHQLMVFGTDTQIRAGRTRYNAIAWIAGNNLCRGQRLLTHDQNGLKAKSGVGLQGHDAQFLAVLGMCNVPANYPLHAGTVKYDVNSLIKSEQRACKPKSELTFTLIGLAHYLDTDSAWTGADGNKWDFQKLIAEELDQPIVGAACGGTHRLMGYAHALRKRRAEGKPIDGHWRRAEVYTDDFISYAYSLQNRDGSMSTNWFEGRADNRDIDRKIQTTGHIVEWLLTVTPDSGLQDQRLVAAISFLVRTMSSDLERDWSIGPKGHALRSLAMYHQRVFRAGTPWIPNSVAQRNQTTRSRR